MYRYLLPVVGLLFLSSLFNAAAQEHRPRQLPAGRPDGSLLQQKLNLSDEQRTQIDKIFEDAKNEAKANKPAKDTDPAELRQLAQQRREETHKKIMGVLNPEQQEKFKAMTQRSNRVRREDTHNHNEKNESQDSQQQVLPAQPGK